MRLTVTPDARAFLARAERFLGARMEHNVHATVAIAAAERRDAGVFMYGVDELDTVVYVALRTPPWPILSTELEPAAAAPVVAAWLDQDPEIPGVSGPPQTARAIAAAWSEATGRGTHLSRSEAMHVLSEVRDPPHPAPGALRAPTSDEHALAIRWLRAFNDEVRDGIGDPELLLEARVGQDGVFVWDDGQPVCLVGCSPPVNRVARVAPVYTPPELRGRGYAGTAVAALSRLLLERGADRCMLFTDLANPTSNKIYAEVGYVRFADWEEHVFD